jgi:hypothetical protein
MFFPLLTGCYPGAHDFVRTQEFSGVLLRGGAPMSGVTASVSHTRGDTGDYCINPEVVARTSETGDFLVPAQIERHYFISMLNPPDMVSQFTSICFAALGNRKLGALMLAPTDHKVKFDGLCEWNASRTEFKQYVQLDPAQWGICTRSGPPLER